MIKTVDTAELKASRSARVRHTGSANEVTVRGPHAEALASNKRYFAVVKPLLRSRELSNPTQCLQIRQAVAQYGYASVRQYALENYGAETVNLGEQCFAHHMRPGGHDWSASYPLMSDSLIPHAVECFNLAAPANKTRAQFAATFA